MTDAELMRSTRDMLHKTQVEMAELIGFSGQPPISQVERGNRNLSETARILIRKIRKEKEGK